MQIISTELINEVTYYITEYRGVRYTCNLNSDGEWCVHSSRISLGKYHVGSFRHFKGVELLASHISAFRQLPTLLSNSQPSMH